MQISSIQSIFDFPEMQQTFKLLWMWGRLLSDVSRLEKPAKGEKDGSGFYRRQYVRAAAALVEGVTSMLKQLALLSPEAFSPEEVLLLREEEPRLKDNGKASTRRRFAPIEANIRFAFTAYAKAKHVAFMPNCSGSDWQDFKQLFVVRHRITHPKKHEELDISDQEMNSIKRGLTLVSKNHSAVHEAIQRSIMVSSGLPEALFQKWLAWQRKTCEALAAGHFEEEWETLRQALDAEVEAFYAHHK